MGLLDSIMGKEKANQKELDEIIAVISIAPFIRSADELTSAAHVQLMETYVTTVFGSIQNSGGRAEYLQGHQIAGFWPADEIAKVPTTLGRTLCQIVRQVRALKLRDDAHCMPAIGLVQGRILHASFDVSGRVISVPLGSAVNIALNLSNLAAPAKSLILLDSRLPVEWPDGVSVVDQYPVNAKGMPEPIPLKAVREIPA